MGAVDFKVHIDWHNQIGKGILDEVFIVCLQDRFLAWHIQETSREQAALGMVLCLMNDRKLKTLLQRFSLFTCSKHHMDMKCRFKP